MSRSSPSFATAQSQSGVALIVVLLFLVLIAIAGAIAVRQGVVDLNVATSDQAGLLMLNNSDSVLAYIEQAAGEVGEEGSDQNNLYKTITSQQNGVLGYFMLESQPRINHQVAFCYRPESADLFSLGKAARWLPTATTLQNASNGICDPTKSEDYTSKRGTALTQVVVAGVENPLIDNFEAREIGMSADISTQPYVPEVEITSAAVLPTMTNASATEIKDCLSNPVGDPTRYGKDKNIPTCLKEKGIPANVLVEEALIRTIQKGGYDVNTGEVTDPCNQAQSGGLTMTASCSQYTDPNYTPPTQNSSDTQTP